MTALAHRLGIPAERITKVSLISGHALPDAKVLFEEAFRVAPEEPDDANLLLASAILARAQATEEGRLAAALAMMAQLIARADPYKTLGPNGAHLREELMPSGWQEMSRSWRKVRYAWREGMVDLLDVRPEDGAIVHALDEITRLHPSEPEPVSVSIKEQFPEPRVAFLITAIGLGLTLRAFVKEMRGNWPGRRR